MNTEIITICGSMVFSEKMITVKEKLKKEGFEVYMPDINEGGVFDYRDASFQEQIIQKNIFIKRHMEKIKKSDAILVVNEKKNGIDGYVGANSFLEMGFAFMDNKKIFLLNNIPEQDNWLEIAGMKPVVIDNNLTKIF